VNPLTRIFEGKGFVIYDKIDEMGEPYRRSFAVAWVKRYGEGNAFYASFGHIVEPFENPAIRAFLSGRHSGCFGLPQRDESMIAAAWLKAQPRSGTRI
jgi:hypothetical protein